MPAALRLPLAIAATIALLGLLWPWRDAPVVAAPAAVRHTALQEWDAARAAAWAHGDVDELRRLYLSGSGRADVAALKRWVARGFVVRRMQRQVRIAQVIRDQPGQRTILVEDRLVSAVAVSRAGAEVGLPSGPWRRVVITLTRRDGAWRCAQISAAPPAPAKQ
ncbi:MAG TPA: hypothetical protein PKK40_00425 [Marmoricola sp.]|nr:hypothetical protein [Marmoricola sp.]